MVLEWFRSYLGNRQQYVHYNKTNSNTPLLFIIYTNYLHTAIPSKCIIFADDTTIYTTGRDVALLSNNMNKDLEQLSHWFKTNNLSRNISKTKYIIFTLNKTTGDDKLKLNIDNSQIHMVDSTNYLGIHIDSRLHWHEHMKHVKKKISSGLYALN